MTNTIVTQKTVYDSMRNARSAVDALNTFADMYPENQDLSDLINLVATGVYERFEDFEQKVISSLGYLPEDEERKTAKAEQG